MRALRRVLFRLSIATVIAAFTAAFTAASAQDSMAMGSHAVSITITNTTSHQTFSAPVLVAHDASYQPFTLGKPVLPELIPLAEDGMTHDFETVAKVEPSILDYAVAKAPLAPGHSVTLQVRVDDGHHLLSAFGMLVTTNDAVFYYGNDLSMSGDAGGSAMAPGSDSMGSSDGMGSSDAMGSSDGMASSDSMAGSGDGMGATDMAGEAMNAHVDLYDGTVRVLDAGSEANTESCSDVPGPPCNSVGVRHTSMAEGSVALHRGLTGSGDLDPAVYGWHDPVATVEVSMP